MTREPIEITRQDRIYCLKASSDYHSEVCEECKFYPNCDHMTHDDLTELTIRELEALEQQPCYNPDEWCRTCSEYNHDKHCCPRYNKVIRNAVEEMKQQTCENVAVTHKNLCDSCTTQGCIFQSGIVRNHCDFYKAESEETRK